MKDLYDILVVDDDQNLLSAVQDAFGAEGFRIRTASTPSQALLEAGDPAVGVVLLDVRLGIREPDSPPTGLQVAREILNRHSPTQIVFFSGYARAEHASAMRELGLDRLGFIPKADVTKDRLSGAFLDALAEYDVRLAEIAADSSETPPSAFQLDLVDLALYEELQRNPDLLRSLDWRRFEELLADILATLGYEVELTKATKDGGIDLIAVARSDDWGEERYLLQAKRWRNKVGIEPVERLLFLHGETGATKSCLATTSSFTRGAWERGRTYRWQLELKDFDGVMTWVRRAYEVRRGR